MSTKIALDKLTLDDLIDLSAQVEATIKIRQETEKADLKRQIEELAGKKGFSVNQLFGGRGSSRKGTTVAIKYQNSKNAAETWTGRGRKPRWLTAKVEQGHKLESFLIK